jgi:hypothetical protein
MSGPTSETGLVHAIQKAVKRIWPDAWDFKVVGSPFQKAGVPDLLYCIEGHLIGVEVKFIRPGESKEHAVGRATPQQVNQIIRIRQAGATADVVTSVDEALDLIRRGLERREKDTTMAEKWKDVEGPPLVGDSAWHKDGVLDPRPVARVEGDQIWIELPGDGQPIGPLPAENYTYSRRVEVAGDGA